jgi:hypothetical protein
MATLAAEVLGHPYGIRSSENGSIRTGFRPAGSGLQLVLVWVSMHPFVAVVLGGA